MNEISGPEVSPGGGLVALGVDVEEGEVALAQRDQVAEGTEVGLQGGDRLAVLRSR